MEMDKASPIGNEISAVFHGVGDYELVDERFLRDSLLEALAVDGFTILNVATHSFKPQGYSLSVLIAESHATLHTYPEYNSLVFSLYTCRGKGDGKKSLEHLKKKLNPESVDVSERDIIVDPNFKTS